MARGGIRPRSGRKPLPASVKKANGTFNVTKERARSAKQAKPARALPPAEKPDTPERGLTVLEKECWERLARQVDKVGTYTEGDEDSFRQLVIAVAAVEECRLGKVNADGTRAVDIRLLNALLGRCAQLFAEFGLTPASRASLSVVDPGKAAADPSMPAADPDSVEMATNIPIPSIEAH